MNECVALVGKQVDSVAVSLGFEELPDGAHLHKGGGPALYFFHLVE